VTTWTEAGWPELEGVTPGPRPIPEPLRKVLASMRGEPEELTDYDDLPAIIAIATDFARDPWVPREVRVGLASVVYLATSRLALVQSRWPSSPPTD
jgi:hypothetical protein